MSFVGEWVNNIWAMHMTYNSALQRKGISSQATAWMTLEHVMLSEIHKNATEGMIPLL